MLKCNQCGYTQWDATQTPYCPYCIVFAWESKPNLIKPKHDPGNLPSGSPEFRSVLTDDVIQNKRDFLSFAAVSGDWYYSKRHHKYCVYSATPLGRCPGSGVPPGNPMPTYAMDGLMVADSVNDTHLYAVDQVRFTSEVGSGHYQRLPRCAESGCHNLVVPGEGKCAAHRTNPLGYY